MIFPVNTWNAAQDFRRARRQASLKDVLSRFTGQSIGLLSYDDVRQKLRAQGGISRGLQEIPLSSIVGSVGRYSDFTRDFLPLQDETQDRWVRVKVAVNDFSGLPPIDVYQIGEAYFVLDGNHRVSVARQMGIEFIQAFVTEVRTKVPLTPDVGPDDLIVKSEYAEFLEKTRIDEQVPGVDLEVTVPGQYRILEEHIQVHRYFMGLEEHRQVSEAEAAQHWYEFVYLPIIEEVRSQGVLWEFPDRTETDLYIWLAEHRAALERELGWEVGTEKAASDLAEQFSTRRQSLTAKLGGFIRETMVPDELEPGPPPGDWRKRKRLEEHDPMLGIDLFTDLLVPVSGSPASWTALDEAIIVSRRENGRIRGLHVVARPEDKESESALAIREEFEQRCQAAGVPGNLTIDHGVIWRKICAHARWVDLLVINLLYPPEPQVLSRLSSGFSNLIRRCPRPVLAVPEQITELKSALLAYDGSPKGQEALFLSAYLAGKWEIPLTVVMVRESGELDPETPLSAHAYLESRGVKAQYIEEPGTVAGILMQQAEANQSELIIMGGYGATPILEVIFGSAVDDVLRRSSRPMLICR